MVDYCSPRITPLRERWRLGLVTGLGAQELPDKTAKLARDGYHRLIALKAAPEEPGVTMVQPVLRAPAKGAHLPAFDLLAPAQVRGILWAGWRNVGRTPPVTSAGESYRTW